MPTNSGLRVLVVEDNRDWSIALQRLYRELIPNAMVQGARTGESALERLRQEYFDLLSIDINLSETHPKASSGMPDYTVPGYDGLDVLEKAAEWDSCSGVVIVSGFQHDDELRFIVKEEDRRRAIMLTPSAYLNRFFPNRNLVLFKSPDHSLIETMEAFKEMLTPGFLLRIADNKPAYETSLLPPYTVDCNDGEVVPRILLFSRGKRTAPVQLREPSDRFFVRQLVAAKRAGIYLSDSEVLQAYRDANSTQVAIDSFRRRLRKLGVDPHALFTRVRASQHQSRGWELCSSVVIRGAASISKSGADPEFVSEDQ